MSGRFWESRRLAVLPLLLLALALALAGCGRPVPRRNVVMVVIDTLRRDHLATYGYSRDTAPFLGELAREGAAFDGLTPAPWTKPATTALLTGLHPVRHQVIGRVDRLPDGAVTLAERLHGAGYQTFGASANGWVSPPFGFDRGFNAFLYRDNFKAAALNRELLPRLGELRPPFFLYVHYIDPHIPYDPVVGWDGRPLPAALRARPVTIQEIDAPHFVQRPRELLTRARDLYDGEIRGSDDALRDLVAGLRRRGLMKNTILVVTADHGEELEDHGRMSHGQTVYQELLQVPLVIHAPRLIAAGLRPGRASLMDVVPTLLDLLGLPQPAGKDALDGASLASLLTSASRPEAARERPFLAHLDFVDGTGLALIEGKWKLVLGKNPYRKELFDLAADPGERHSLLGSPAAAEVFPRLARELSDVYGGYSRAALARTTVAMADRLTRSLADLGYVAGGRSEPDRQLPRRIGPADPFPDGRLGWSSPGSVANCAQMGKEDAGRSLLAGWYEPDGAGRWSAQDGTLLLAAPDPSSGQLRPGLMVSGNNFRPSPVRVTLSVNRHEVLETELKAGPFHLSASLAGVPLDSLSMVRIATDSEFVPSRVGLPDQRSLGLYLTRICLEPDVRAGD
ncbi:MAG TPA: sulfatase [Thermoanaerobaculia bacterium]